MASDREAGATRDLAASDGGGTDSDTAPFAYEGLDRALHEKARLGILTSLMTHAKPLSFGDLRRLCALTDGNLSRHLRTLEDAGVVAVTKTFEKRRPLTTVSLTPAGRQRFIDYLAILEQVVREARPDTAAQNDKPIPEGRILGKPA